MAKDRRTAWLLVFGQFALLAVIVLLPGSASWTLPAGLAAAGRAAEVAAILVMVVAATTLGRSLTATPLPNEHAQLRTRGHYGYVRHPIYSGLLLFAIARTLTHGSSWVAAACVLLIVLINVKARWEERHLARRFPDYRSYASRTPNEDPPAKVGAYSAEKAGPAHRYNGHLRPAERRPPQPEHPAPSRHAVRTGTSPAAPSSRGPAAVPRPAT